MAVAVGTPAIVADERLDDSEIVAALLVHQGRVLPWRHYSVLIDSHVDAWALHALDGGRRYADLTVNDLAVLRSRAAP